MQTTLESLAYIVREMRKAQTEYFRTRTGTALRASKQLEAQVDKILSTVPETEKPEQCKMFE